MKPLPPIEQYNIYSNNYMNSAMVQQTVPIKRVQAPSNRQKTLNQHESEMLLKDNLAKMQNNKRSERNAMVKEIFATKNSMNRDASQTSVSKAKM